MAAVRRDPPGLLPDGGIQGRQPVSIAGEASAQDSPGCNAWERETRPMMTDRIRAFLDERRPEGPCLVVDLDVVRRNYDTFRRVLPDSRIFYAVKANPSPEVLSLLSGLGSSFDTASVPEIEMALSAGPWASIRREPPSVMSVPRLPTTSRAEKTA